MPCTHQPPDQQSAEKRGPRQREDWRRRSQQVGVGSRRVRRPASPGISQSADILPASTGTCVYGVEATTRSTSVRG